MQSDARPSRNPASSDLGVRRNTPGRMIEPGRCRNRRSHPTQYPRFHETVHALGIGYAEYGRKRAEVIVDTAIFSACQGRSPESTVSSVGDSVTRQARTKLAGANLTGAVVQLEGGGIRAGRLIRALRFASGPAAHGSVRDACRGLPAVWRGVQRRATDPGVVAWLLGAYFEMSAASAARDAYAPARIKRTPPTGAMKIVSGTPASVTGMIGRRSRLDR